MEQFIRMSNILSLGLELESDVKQFVVNNGVIKEYKPSRFSRRIINNNDIFVKLSDLPIDIQSKLSSESITSEELVNISYKKKSENNIYSEEGTKVYVTEDTPVLPIVGNFLPSDGVNAYTAVYKEDGSLGLEPILVCWNCHWADLFTGNTKYGENVFCLVSDLPIDVIERARNYIIPLSEAPNIVEISKSKGR